MLPSSCLSKSFSTPSTVTFNESVNLIFSNVMFPVFVIVIVYSITSPGLTITFVKSSISTNSVLPFDFNAVAALSTSNDGASSTITVSSPSPSIGSGSILGSVGTVVPDATTLLYIVLSGFPVTSGTCTTVYVAVITAFPAGIAGVTTSPSSFSTASLAALK